MTQLILSLAVRTEPLLIFILENLISPQIWLGISNFQEESSTLALFWLPSLVLAVSYDYLSLACWNGAVLIGLLCCWKLYRHFESAVQLYRSYIISEDSTLQILQIPLYSLEFHTFTICTMFAIVIFLIMLSILACNYNGGWIAHYFVYTIYYVGRLLQNLSFFPVLFLYYPLCLFYSLLFIMTLWKCSNSFNLLFTHTACMCIWKEQIPNMVSYESWNYCHWSTVQQKMWDASEILHMALIWCNSDLDPNVWA